MVIYHAHCSDGLGAAWVFHQAMPNAEFCPILAGSNEPPDVDGKNVFIVDCAYPRDTILKLRDRARSLLVLDHHKSNMEALGDLDFCQFDMTRSGIGLAWDYLFPHKQRHWLVNYIEDKDLWRWIFPNSREINCAIQSYPLSFEGFYILQDMKPDDLISEGMAIHRYQKNMVDSIVKKAREIEIQGHKVLIVNTNVLQSEVAGFLAINRPFGVSWFENEFGHKVYSLRSKDGGKDVSEIAKKYPGGGGHFHSAGFRLKLGDSI
jgi:uncharacterized protein